MVATLGVICFLMIIIIGVMLTILADNRAAHGQVEDLQTQINRLSGRVNTVARESKNSHARLVDNLWRRASEQVDQEIKEARARGRDYQQQ